MAEQTEPTLRDRVMGLLLEMQAEARQKQDADPNPNVAEMEALRRADQKQRQARSAFGLDRERTDEE